MLFVGIDWSDRSLEFHARSTEGQALRQGSVEPNLAGLSERFSALETHARPSDIAIFSEPE